MAESVPTTLPASRARGRPPWRRWSHIPVRWRLTGLYAFFLAAGLLLFGVVMYAGLRFTSYESLDEQTEDHTALVLLTIQQQGGNLLLYPSDAGDLESDEYFVRLLNARGQVITDTSEAFGGAPLNDRDIDRAMSGASRFTSVSVDGETFRVMTEPVRSGDDNVIGVLQVGMSREDIDESLREMAFLMLILGPLLLLLASVAGYLLAGRAMAPVRDIAHRAASIDAADLHARLNLDLPNDELGELARTFDMMLARIESAFERQKRFTGDAAHELRTPLSLMRSQIDLALMGDRSDTEYRSALASLQSEVTRLTDIVSALLTLARADAGKLPVTYTACDLAESIGVVCEQFAAQAEHADVQLIAETTPVTVEADEDLLLVVLVNLVSNAIGSTPAGGSVTVGCRNMPDEALFWVADTGPGLTPEQQERVFDRFYRLDQGREGSGLGLNICRAIVNAHAGQIEVSSAIGQGARVTVRLPVRRPAA